MSDMERSEPNRSLVWFVLGAAVLFVAHPDRMTLALLIVANVFRQHHIPNPK
jgi:hypothetical protein